MKKKPKFEIVFYNKTSGHLRYLIPCIFEKNNEMYNAHTDAIGNLIG